MADKFAVRKEDKGGSLLISMEGVLDEDAKLQPELAGLSGDVRINLKGITAINSCGIREWVTAVRDLEKTCKLTFEEVSVAMIQQFNMVLNARGSGKVLSFFAPYFCGACDKEAQVMLDPVQNPNQLGTAGALEPPEHKCGSCGGVLEFDDIPEKYFLFLETQLSG